MIGAPPHTCGARNRRSRYLLAALFVLLALTACRPPADREAANVGEVSVELLTRPARVGPAAIDVRVTRSGEPVGGASVRVTGDMTHAGMVPVLADATEVEPGLYRSDGFAFDMAGDWMITADVTYRDGERDQGTLAVSVSR